MAHKRGPVAEYFFQIAVAVDRLWNAILGGSSDETLSSRAHRNQDHGKPFWVLFAAFVDNLFFWQKSHCRQSWHNEVNRRNPAAEHLANRQLEAVQK